MLNEGDNIGGLSTIEIAHVSDFESFVPVRFKAGRYWREIEFHPMSGLLKEDVQESDHGLYYSYAGSFRIPKSDKVTECLLEKYMGQVSVFRITDQNEKRIVVGAPEWPVQFSRASDTGSSPADPNHAAYSLVVSQPKKALYG